MPLSRVGHVCGMFTCPSYKCLWHVYLPFIQILRTSYGVLWDNLLRFLRMLSKFIAFPYLVGNHPREWASRFSLLKECEFPFKMVGIYILLFEESYFI